MIGDALGVYVDADLSYKITREMFVVRILVLLDLREGLSPEIFLNMVLRDVVHELDYEGVPFRCHLCHSEEHLVAQCDWPFRGYFRVDGQKDWSREGGASKKAKESSIGDWPPFSSSVQSDVELIPRVV